jgi:REP element-mobilizing transposase RayT
MIDLTELNLIILFMKIEYNNLYTHFIFTTQHRIPLIPEIHRSEIEKYITGIIKNHECHLYSIYANPDHIHFLVSRTPNISEETLANIIETSSESFINRKRFCQGEFRWQGTCSAFSVSKSDVDRVCRYILNQATHHRKISFSEEYEKFLKFYQQTIILI